MTQVTVTNQAVDAEGTATKAPDSPERRQLLSQATLAAAGAVVGAALAPGTAGAQSKSWMDCDSPNAGSDAILKALNDNMSQGHTLTKEHVVDFVTSLKKNNAKIVDWCQYGQPAVDGVCGTVHVLPGQLGGLIGALAARPGAWKWGGVFPIGIPFPDRFALKFGLGNAPRGVVIIDG